MDKGDGVPRAYIMQGGKKDIPINIQCVYSGLKREKRGHHGAHRRGDKTADSKQ